MKKHLIAAAISAAVAVPALAQVTVYGTIDTSVVSVNKVGTTDQTSVTQTAVQSSQWTTNRIGFRGEEDLGGGMKASFGMESGHNSDSAAAFTMGNRGSFVGLTGGFGSIRIGGSVATLHNGANVGSFGNFTDLSLGTVASGRPTNAVIYDTPTFNGVRAQFALGQGEGSTQATKNNANYQSIGLTGKVGAFSFTVVQAHQKSQAGAGSTQRCVVFFQNATVYGFGGNNTGIATGPSDGSCTIGANVAASSAFTFNGTTGTAATTALVTAAAAGGQITTLTPGILATGAYNAKTKDTGITLAYDFGVANLQYQRLNKKTSGDYGVGTTTSTTAATFTAVDQTAQGMTLVVPMGQISPFVHYHEFENKLVANGRGDHDVTVLGVNYALSKRTNAYAVWSQYDRNAASTVVHGRATSAAGVADAKSTATSIGLRHSF